jgi:hypothetical protein
VSRSKPRIKGATGYGTYRKPVCSQGHPSNQMRKEPEGWICFGCVDEYRRKTVESRAKGVILPAGVAAPDSDFHPTTEIMGNRRMRRRMR